MKKLGNAQIELIIAGGGNCQGIYRSCLNAAALAGAAGVLATAGWGIVFTVLAVSAAMDYCYQQYLGCD